MRELLSVVCTGWGAITPRGDASAHDGSTLAQESTTTRAEFALENYLDSKKTYLDRCSAWALAGGALALRDAGLAWPRDDDRFGITLGTHFGGVETMHAFWDNVLQKGTRLANPILFSHSYFNSPISLCAIEFGLKGFHTSLCANEYSGLEAVRAAYDVIRLGHADAMLCGAVEAATPTRTLCTNKNDNGEAAVFFVLEEQGCATARAAQPAFAVDDTWFESAKARLPETASRFGNCGGAQSALALLLAHGLS